MFNFSNRIYKLSFNHLFIYSNKYFFFLVNHRSYEMILKAFSFGLKFNGLRYYYIFHPNKLFFCNSFLKNNTFNINNYINFFIFYKLKTVFFIFKNIFFLKKEYYNNIKNIYLNHSLLFLNKFNLFFLKLFFNIFNYMKLKIFYFYKCFLFFLFFRFNYSYLYEFYLN